MVEVGDNQGAPLGTMGGIRLLPHPDEPGAIARKTNESPLTTPTNLPPWLARDILILHDNQLATPMGITCLATIVFRIHLPRTEGNFGTRFIANNKAENYAKRSMGSIDSAL
jgi:hypothetical protein